MDEAKNILEAANAPRACRICSERSDGAHFGVDSCRACAAFFRRSIVLKKTYVCRQGGNRCVINKSIRCMCRKCRFRRCLECGMQSESVQRKKENTEATQNVPSTSSDTGSVLEFLTPLVVPPSTSSCSSVTSPSENEIGSQLQRCTGSAFQPVHGSSSSSSLIPAFPTYQPQREKLLLETICENYRHTCSVRKATEIANAGDRSLRGLFDAITDTPGLRSATVTQITKVFKAEVPILAEFITLSFPEISDLRQEDKWVLFQNYVSHLWFMESAYRTATLFPVTENRKLLATQTTFMDMGAPESFFDEGEVNGDPKQVADLFLNHLNLSVEYLVKPMRDMGITDLEFCALQSLCFWGQECLGMREQRPEVIQLCRRMRSKIFHELHLHYRRDRNMDDYADRIGNLMMLFCAIQRNLHLMKEDIELFKLFNVFEVDSFIYDIVKTA